MSATREQREPVGWHLLAAALAVAVLAAQFLLDRGANPYLRGAGIACLLVSPVFIFPPFFLLSRYGRPSRGQPYYCTTAVVDRGVYSIVRHPQYVGYVLLTLGFAALSQRVLTSLLAVCCAGAFYVQSLREEAYCQKRSGQKYLAYMRRVPRFNFFAGLFRYLFARR